MPHVIQVCPEYHELKKKYWLSEMTLNQNEIKEELQTVELILGTDLVV